MGAIALREFIKHTFFVSNVTRALFPHSNGDVNSLDIELYYTTRIIIMIGEKEKREKKLISFSNQVTVS